MEIPSINFDCCSFSHKTQ